MWTPFQVVIERWTVLNEDLCLLSPPYVARHKKPRVIEWRYIFTKHALSDLARPTTVEAETRRRRRGEAFCLKMLINFLSIGWRFLYYLSAEIHRRDHQWRYGYSIYLWTIKRLFCGQEMIIQTGIGSYRRVIASFVQSGGDYSSRRNAN